MDPGSQSECSRAVGYPVLVGCGHTAQGLCLQGRRERGAAWHTLGSLWDGLMVEDLGYVHWLAMESACSQALWLGK